MRRQQIPAIAALALSLGTPAVAIAASASSQTPALSPAAVRATYAAAAQRQAALRAARARTRARHDEALHRATRLARTRDRLAGRRPASRRHYRASFATWSTSRLRKHTRRLRHRIAVLRRTGGAPAIAIPPQLHAIAACESGGNPRAVSANGAYRGLFQFDYGTWASVGGHGDPAAAPAEEQYRRAAMLYARSGSSPWPVCGR